MFLSIKARRLVDEAIQRLPSQTDRQVWDDWARSHPNIKHWNSAQTEQDIMPPDVVRIAASALSLLAASLEVDVQALPSGDDELVQLDNTLAYVRLIERNLSESIY
jgi:hypothetical protein